MTASPDINPAPVIPGAPTAVDDARRILRSPNDRVLAGVCGGIAEHYGAEAWAVRLLAVVLAVLTGLVPLAVIYLIAAILIPLRGEGEVPVPGTTAAVTPGRAGLIAGIVLIAVGALALVNEWYGVDWDQLWPLGLMVLGGALVVAARRQGR